MLRKIKDECRQRAFHVLASKPSATMLSLLVVHAEQCLQRLETYGITFKGILETVSDFQRTCLDIIGLCNYIETFHPRTLPLSPDQNKIWPVDPSIMGIFTESILSAQYFHRMGVPVWLVRPQFAVQPSRMKIYSSGLKEGLSRDLLIALEEYFSAVDLYVGFPSSQMHMAMQRVGCRVADYTEQTRREWERYSGTAAQLPTQQGKPAVHFFTVATEITLSAHYSQCLLSSTRYHSPCKSHSISLDRSSFITSQFVKSGSRASGGNAAPHTNMGCCR
jgi:hypothetical protein